MERQNIPVAVVDVRRQRMTVRLGGRIVMRCLVSTGKAGVGSEAGSGRTPPGCHRVASFHGARAVPGQVFVSRKAVKGRVIPSSRWTEDGGPDLILTRILRLEGLEPGVNKGEGIDSFKRYIYIHGTNQEHLLGTPASHGCIRMSNKDVIDLFSIARRNGGLDVNIRR